jgi:uncharacterized protein YgbK (DUF1537 family)
MGLVLGAIADDYTGASDLANVLTRNGLRTVQTVGIPDPALQLPDVDAVVVSLKIRSVAAESAMAAARKADRWLRANGAIHVLYKICSTFDSTDAGNIGPVTQALAEDAGAGIVIVTPAFPATGRTVYRGHLFVDDQLLSESPLKDHPLNPMRDANLVRVLGRQSQRLVGLIDFDTISRGRAAVTERLSALAAAGWGMAIVDALTDADLETIGAVALAAPVSTGASGVGLGLARALVASGRVSAANLDKTDSVPVGGPVAIVAGSCSNATLEQIAVAERTIPVYRLDPAALLAPDHSSEIRRALEWAMNLLDRGPVLIAASSPPDIVAALQARYGREASGHAIESATSAIAEGLAARGVRRLILAGGETSGAAIDRLQIPAFLIEQEIAPGVPVMTTVGGTRPRMRFALKSGNFGGPNFFQTAIGMVQ